MHWLTWLLVLPLLAGCQTAVKSEGRWFRPAVGTEVVLKAPLTVPADAARVFLQRGEVMGWGEVRQLLPHCHFEVREVLEAVQTIHPDRFRVTRLDWGYERVVYLGPSLVARASLAQSAPDDGLPSIARYVRLHLESTAQPNVMRLTCHGAYDEWAEAEEPTPEEIRAALGGWVVFVFP